MTRQKLPNARASLTFEFNHAYPGAEARRVTASLSVYPDGRCAEIFVDLVNGTDKAISVDAHDAAVLLSFALQHGATLDAMGAAMLRGETGAPHGLMGSLIDAAAKAAGAWK